MKLWCSFLWTEYIIIGKSVDKTARLSGCYHLTEVALKMISENLEALSNSNDDQKDTVQKIRSLAADYFQETESVTKETVEAATVASQWLLEHTDILAHGRRHQPQNRRQGLSGAIPASSSSRNVPLTVEQLQRNQEIQILLHEKSNT